MSEFIFYNNILNLWLSYVAIDSIENTFLFRFVSIQFYILFLLVSLLFPVIRTKYTHKHKQCTSINKNTDTELEDDSDENNIPQIEQNPGVDDGFFIGTRADNPDDADNRNNSNDNPNINHNNIPNETHPTFPFAPGFNPNVVSEMMCIHFNYSHKIMFFLRNLTKHFVEIVDIRCSR